DADTSDKIDLSAFAPSQVTQTASGNDLVLGLGSNGSITVRNYYAGNRPEITFSAAAPRFSINDPRVTEGNSGTTPAVFTVSLSAPSSSTVAVNYATANGSAVAGSDYVGTSGVLSFAPGETAKTITVSVIGDTTVEPDEVFSVLLSAPTAGAEIADGQGDA